MCETLSRDHVVSGIDYMYMYITWLRSLKQKVRVAALQCIKEMTGLPHHVLYPHKPEVIRCLAKPLDDQKRLVRKEAVAARSEWLVYAIVSAEYKTPPRVLHYNSPHLSVIKLNLTTT